MTTLLNPTHSNSSGNYFLTQQDYDFNNSEINCNSIKRCLIRCTDNYSCHNTIIRCNDAINCDIECDNVVSTTTFPDQSVCTNMTIYVSSHQTSISCPQYSCKSLTKYTDYKNYPLSETELSCGPHSCYSIQIHDACDQSHV